MKEDSLPEIEMPVFEELEAYRDYLIERGLSECLELLPKQKDTMIPFYKGSIDEFEHCKSITNIMEMENRFRQLQKDVHDKYFATGSNLSANDLNDYWYLNGRKTQAEFLFERLKLYYLQPGNIVSTRDYIDFHEYLRKISKKEDKNGMDK